MLKLLLTYAAGILTGVVLVVTALEVHFRFGRPGL